MNKRAIIRSGKIIYDTLPTHLKPNETAARERREGMKTKHRKDLLQKTQPEYYKAHPEQAEGFSDEVKRLLS